MTARTCSAFAAAFAHWTDVLGQCSWWCEIFYTPGDLRMTFVSAKQWLNEVFLLHTWREQTSEQWSVRTRTCWRECSHGVWWKLPASERALYDVNCHWWFLLFYFVRWAAAAASPVHSAHTESCSIDVYKRQICHASALVPGVICYQREREREREYQTCS